MAKKTQVVSKRPAGDIATEAMTRVAALEARVARLEAWATTLYNSETPPVSLVLPPGEEHE